MIDLSEFCSLIPIKTLAPDYCRELLEQSVVCELPAGADIFRAGEPIEEIVYLLSGEVGLISGEHPVKLIRGGTNASKLPLEQGKIHRVSAQAKTDVHVVKVDPSSLDAMLAWGQTAGYEVQEIIGPDASPVSGDWMTKLLQIKLFRRIPANNIQSVFLRMQTEHYVAGDTVIKQGEPGEHFYIVREGQCQVIRQTRKNPEGMVLATLTAGDTFGEEALISGGDRNASVVMQTDGVLISLAKSDFLELLNEPLLSWMSYEAAKAAVMKGAVWIDVRLPREFDTQHIKESLNIPLPLLRYKLVKLNPEIAYIVYCDTGRRSAIAAYLMSQNGFDVAVLKGAMDSVPTSEFGLKLV